MNLVFATATICLAVMLPVLISLRASGGPGIRSFSIACGLAIASLCFSAAADIAFPSLLRQVASLLMIAGAMFTLSGFRSFLGRRPLSSRSMTVFFAGGLVVFLILAATGDSMKPLAMLRGGMVSIILLWITATILRYWPRDRTLTPHILFCCLASFAAAFFQVIHTGSLPNGEPFTPVGDDAFIGSALIVARAVSVPVLFLSIVLLQQGWIISKLRHRVSRDDLTGILSRRAFMEQYERQLCLSNAAKKPSAFMLLDLDRFKQINDRHGHAGGDAALLHFAAVVRMTLENRHVFGRLGGEEFGIVLPETDIFEAMQLAEKLCAAVRRTPAKSSAGIDIPMTVSIGLAMADPQGTATDLMHRADMALYDAKATGRDGFSIGDVAEQATAASARALAGAAAEMRAALDADRRRPNAAIG